MPRGFTSILILKEVRRTLVWCSGLELKEINNSSFHDGNIIIYLQITIFCKFHVTCKIPFFFHFALNGEFCIFIIIFIIISFFNDNEASSQIIL